MAAPIALLRVLSTQAVPGGDAALCLIDPLA